MTVVVVVVDDELTSKLSVSISRDQTRERDIWWIDQNYCTGSMALITYKWIELLRIIGNITQSYQLCHKPFGLLIIYVMLPQIWQGFELIFQSFKFRMK